LTCANPDPANLANLFWLQVGRPADHLARLPRRPMNLANITIRAKDNVLCDILSDLFIYLFAHARIDTVLSTRSMRLRLLLNPRSGTARRPLSSCSERA